MTVKIDKPPAGFYYLNDFITEKEEQYLLTKIVKLSWEKVKMHGLLAKRRVLHFGHSYHYDSKTVEKTTPIPPFLKPIIKRAASKMKIKHAEIVEVLITKYSVGAGIGWHRDAKIFGDQVFGISLLSATPFKFRIKRNDEYQIFKIELAPRSAYILAGDSRLLFEHSIAPVKHKRYSITLRTLKKRK